MISNFENIDFRSFHFLRKKNIIIQNKFILLHTGIQKYTNFANQNIYIYIY